MIGHGAPCSFVVSVMLVSISSIMQSVDHDNHPYEELYAGRVSNGPISGLAVVGRAGPAQPASIQHTDALSAPTSQLRAARITGSGQPNADSVAGPSHLRFGSVEGAQRSVAADADGGVFVGWVDGRRGNPDIYIERLTADGSPARGWPNGGLLVCGAEGSQYQLDTAPDGAGGVFLAWQDYRHDGRGRVYFQRITANGAIAEGWPAGGRPLNAGTSEQTRPRIVADRSGAYLLWSERIGRNLTLHLARRSAQGDTVVGWPSAGQTITDSRQTVRASAMAIDDQGRTVIVWQQADSLGVNSLRGLSLSAGRDPSTPLPVPALLVPSAVDVTEPTLQLVGEQVVAVWGEWQTTGASLRTQRLDLSSGTWSAMQTIKLRDGDVLGHNPPAVLADTTGLFVAWESHDDVGSKVRVQRIGASGSVASGWDSIGVLASATPGSHYAPTLRSDGAGGIVVTWLSVPPVQADGAVAARAGEVSVQLLEATAASGGRARLVWVVSGGMREWLEVERRAEEGDWAVIGRAAPDDSGRVAFEDQAAPQGTTTAYRLVRLVGETRYNFPEVLLKIPRLPVALAIHWARAEAPRNRIILALALPSSAPVELQLHDVSGRRVARQRLEYTEGGEYEVPLDLPRGLRSGVYFVRVQQAGKFRSTKVSFVR